MSSKNTLSIITLGQSPRFDFDIYIEKYLNHFEVTQYGVMDYYDISYDYIQKDVETFFTILHNKKEIEISKKYAHNKIQDIIDDINSKNSAHIILIACTGDFSSIKSKIPVLSPDKLLGEVISTLLTGKKITVCIPAFSQVEQIKEKWSKYDVETDIVAISPYIFDNNLITSATEQIKHFNNSFVLGDCIGYNKDFKVKIEKNTNFQIILSAEFTFATISAFL